MSLLGHYLAETGITQVDGKVSLWADQSGNGNNLEQTVALNRPKYVLGAVNGFNVIRFEGAENLLALNNTMLDLTTSSATLVTVCVPHIDGAGLVNRAMGKTTNLGGSDAGYQHRQGSGIAEPFFTKYADGASRKSWEGKDRASTIFGNLHVWLSKLNYPSSADLHVQGALDNFTNQDAGGNLVNLTTTQKFEVGTAGGISFYYGDILEARVYDSAEDLDALFTELSNKYSGDAGKIIQPVNGSIYGGGVIPGSVFG